MFLLFFFSQTLYVLPSIVVSRCCNRRKHGADSIEQFPCEHEEIIIIIINRKRRQHFHWIKVRGERRDSEILGPNENREFSELFQRPKFSFRFVSFRWCCCCCYWILWPHIRILVRTSIFITNAHMRTVHLVLDPRKLRVCLHFGWHTLNQNPKGTFPFCERTRAPRLPSDLRHFHITFQPNSNVCVCVRASVSTEHTQSVCRLVQLQNRKPTEKINRVQEKRKFLERMSRMQRERKLLIKRSVEMHKKQKKRCSVVFTSSENEFIKNDPILVAFFFPLSLFMNTLQ